MKTPETEEFSKSVNRTSEYTKRLGLLKYLASLELVEGCAFVDDRDKVPEFDQSLVTLCADRFMTQEVETCDLFLDSFESEQTVMQQRRGDCPNLVQIHKPFRSDPTREEVALYYKDPYTKLTRVHYYTGGPRIEQDQGEPVSMDKQRPAIRYELSARNLRRWRLWVEPCTEDRCVLCCKTCRLGGKFESEHQPSPCQPCHRTLLRLFRMTRSHKARVDKWRKEQRRRFAIGDIEWPEPEPEPEVPAGPPPTPVRECKTPAGGVIKFFIKPEGDGPSVPIPKQKSPPAMQALWSPSRALGAMTLASPESSKRLFLQPVSIGASDGASVQVRAAW
jgi:hypothetical protein